jgi:sugar/nucleoside kinase (ribokinase family)
MLSREAICQQTSKKLSSTAASLKSTKAVVGFDGFVDEIIAVVDKRQSNDRYEAIRAIETFGEKIVKASGQSSNYELIVKQMKLGGNGPIMANALSAIGLDVTYIGNLGSPEIHPVFADFARRAHVISIAEAAHTDALEFDDGKLMLGKLTPLNAINWKNLLTRIGHDQFTRMIGSSRLVGMVNWTMLPHMSEIWKQMIDEVFPKIARDQRKVFIDLADPEKRTHEDIVAALKLLTKMQQQADVILGLNLKESVEVAGALGLQQANDAEAAIEETARMIRERLDLACVVVHPRTGAAAASRDASASFMGPFVKQPKISTGAGDHFNAGFAVGQMLGFTLEESLCVGVATSGYYVRNAISPSAQQLAEFIAELPPPQG